MSRCKVRTFAYHPDHPLLQHQHGDSPSHPHSPSQALGGCFNNKMDGQKIHSPIPLCIHDNSIVSDIAVILWPHCNVVTGGRKKLEPTSKASISPSRARTSRHRHRQQERVDKAWVYKKRLERVVFMDKKKGTWSGRLTGAMEMV